MSLFRPNNQTKKYYKKQDNTVTYFKEKYINNAERMGKLALEQQH